jgi:hemerythrin-like domain-containing protein/beta-phosphoglucomutase-like phosphatase (HAD superfamily)
MSKQQRVFFFDVRNTLGAVDRKGHLVQFRPSTGELLKSMQGLEGARLAVITNVPPGVDAIAMLKGAGLDGFFEKVISTQDPEILAAKAEKPQRTMYEFAAKAMGASPADCTYVSENILEVLGAINAGMSGVVKKFPPGGDYMRQNLARGTVTPVASGRLSEAVLEGQHIVGARVVVCAMKIVERLRAGDDPLAPNSALLSGMTRLVWLVNNFIDPYHHRMEEEALLPFAHMRGYPPAKTAWMLEEHDQGRAYFKAMTIALKRVQSGNRNAILEFTNVVDAFAQLYRVHGAREDDEMFKEIGDLLTDEDDAVVCGMIERLGPPDITLHYDMIQGMERDLGVEPK